MSPVIAIDKCPSRSATALICTPASSHATAAECNSVWTPTSDMAAFAATSKDKVTRPDRTRRPPKLSRQLAFDRQTRCPYSTDHHVRRKRVQLDKAKLRRGQTPQGPPAA